MKDISTLNEELQKALGKSTLGYVEQAENSREKIQELIGENEGLASTLLLKKAEELAKALGNKSVPNAFQSIEDYTKLTSSLNSAISQSDMKAINRAISSPVSSYLKPEYGATLEAFDSVKNGLAYALAHNVDGINDKLESVKKTALQLESNKSILDTAKQFANISSLIDADIYKSDFKKISNNEYLKSKYKEPIIPEKVIKSYDIPLPPKFEDTPLGKQNIKLVEHSEKQTKLLTLMASHFEKQKEHIDRQTNLTNIQIEKAQEQVDALKLQNKTMTIQATLAEKQSKFALWGVAITLFVSSLFSAFTIYQADSLFKQQDISDNKNNQELLKVIDNKKILENQILKLQVQIDNQSQLVELIKEQNGYLSELMRQKSVKTNQSVRLLNEY